MAFMLFAMIGMVVVDTIYIVRLRKAIVKYESAMTAADKLISEMKEEIEERKWQRELALDVLNGKFDPLDL